MSERTTSRAAVVVLVLLAVLLVLFWFSSSEREQAFAARDTAKNLVVEASSLVAQLNSAGTGDSLRPRLDSIMSEIAWIQANLVQQATKGGALQDSIDNVIDRLRSVRSVIPRSSVESERIVTIAATLAAASEALNRIEFSPVGPSDLPSLVQSLAWLVAVGFVVLLVGTSQGRKRLTEVLDQFESIRLWGGELVIDKAAADKAEDVFQRSRAEANEEYATYIDKLDLQSVFDTWMKDSVVPLLDRDRLGNLRSTLYAPDSLFDDTLQQILDYWPDGGGRGRVFSMRFGIIGKAWRLGSSEVEGNVPTGEDGLVSEWGMTLEEAQGAGLERKSFAAILVRAKLKKIGVVFLDHPEAEYFPESFAAQLEKSLKGSKVERRLQRVHSEFLPTSPQLQLLER